MTFRGRLTAVAATAVAVSIVLASVVIFFVVRSDLRNRVDASLVDIAATARVGVLPDGVHVGLPQSAFGGAAGYAQLIRPTGVASPPGQRTIPPSPAARAVAAGERGPLFEDAHVAGLHLRIYTTTLPDLPRGFALQVARPLTEVDQALQRLGFVLGFVSVAGVALAAAMGFAVTRTAVRPITALTEATEHVTETGDLSRRIDVTGEDEVGRLASSFNAMMAALESSMESQRRLVADASHELRTPLTSLRTNIDVLAGEELPAEDRERLLADVRSEIGELTLLIGDLVEAGRGNEPGGPMEPVRFDLLVRGAISRAVAHSGGRNRFDADLEPTSVLGVPDRLERAVSNLLDNATKWSPHDGEVQVRLHGGELTVRDHGPGVASEDLPHVFDRFYRSPSARGTPGSGLGLSIVRQVAGSHGGTVTVSNADGGGAEFRLQLPTIQPEPWVAEADPAEAPSTHIAPKSAAEQGPATSSDRAVDLPGAPSVPAPPG